MTKVNGLLVISEGVWIDQLNNPNVQKIYEDAISFEKQIHSGEVDSAHKG